jgi:hypothetical protein
MAGACGRFASTPIPPPAVWYLAAPFAIGTSDTAISIEGGLALLDTATLRPVLVRRGGTSAHRMAVFTNFEGGRYHADVVRSIAEDSSIYDPFARAVEAVTSSAGDGLLLDLQELSEGDLPRLMPLARAIADAARAARRFPVGIIIPAADTLGYPAPLLARIADVIVIRFGGEHRPGTGPGPLVSPDFLRREIGMRANGLGASRLAVEFPLFGYLWSRDGSARPITYREANTLVLREAGAFRRDPTSQFLSATGRDGWTIWLPDAATIQSLIGVAQSRGITTIALSGTSGADPLILRPDFLRR